MESAWPASSPSNRWPGWRDTARAALLFALLLAAYFPALHGGRLLDDDLHITRPALQSAAGLRRIWFEVGATQQYYPVVHTAFWLEHRLWGDAVLGYHLANVLEHGIAALLVVPLMRRLRLPGAWLAAFLFALHPVCVESVAWIAEQKNTLSALAAIGAAVAYLRFDETRERSRYGLALGLFALAVLSKTAVVALPGALLVIGWWRRPRLTWGRDVAPLLPWFALGGAVSLVTLGVERGLLADVGLEVPVPGFGRVAVAGRAFWFYLGKVLWPTGLTFFYPRWRVTTAPGWQVLYPLAAVALGGGLLLLARRRRGPLAAFLCFVSLLAPVLGAFRMEWFVFSYVADHLQYLALLGVLVPLAAVLAAGAESRHAWRRLGPILAVIAVAALGVATGRQSRRYTDPLTFYRAAVAANPASAAAHDKLGATLATSPGSGVEAIAEFDQALHLQPDLPGAYYNRGSAYLRLGRLPEAITDLQQALRLAPPGPDVLTNLGDALARSHRLPEAIERYEAALRIEPAAADTQADLARAHADLGFALAGERRFAAAAEQQASAVRLEPWDAAYRISLGHLLLLDGQPDAAIVQYEAALKLRPYDPQISRYLAMARSLGANPRDRSP